MLRILHSLGSAAPYSIPCDSSASFQPGQVAQFTVIGNQICATVSNGTAPFGIIDDIKTIAHTTNAIDEEVIVMATGVPGPGNTLVSLTDVKIELKNPNILSSSFTSNPVPVQLIPRNGVVVFPAGTELNYDLIGSGTPNAIRTFVRYTYQIPNIVGDDSTQGSGRMTVWYQRMIAATDQFEASQVYPINANIFVSETGLLTTRRIAENYPAIGFVTAPPSSLTGLLEFVFL